MAPSRSDISDDESSGEAIPFKNKASSNEEDENGDGESGDEEDVYVVESIVGHEFQKNGKLMLNVKWKGYDDPADQTLEPEEGLLEGAEEIVREYYDKIGGRPEPPGGTKSGRGKRKSMTGARATPENQSTKRQKLASKEKVNGAEVFNFEKAKVARGIPDWVPDKKQWGRDVKEVRTIANDAKHGLLAYLVWTNDKMTKVSLEKCYDTIPRMMLKFYEQHLVFKNDEEEEVGEEEAGEGSEED